MEEGKANTGTITFDDLEITIGTKREFTTLDNRYSEHDGKTVVKIPVKLKNLKDETHGLNMFKYKFYNPKGNEVRSVDSYFDNNLSYSGDMRSGAEINTYIYLLYEGNGDYFMEFNDYKNKQEIKIPVK